MKTSRIESISPEHCFHVRRSAAALTALIMARGLAGLHAAEDATASAKAGEPSTLDKVVVEDTKPKQISSPKFTEPLRDTPQTLVVIPREVYGEQGATNLSEVLRNTPGITFAAGEGGSAASTAGDSFYLRGFDTSNNIFVDGVRDVGAYTRDVFNVEQVEVAKGPAGSDIGRGGSSGYVNLATKVPRLEDFVTGTLSYGFDDATSNVRQRAALDVNETLGLKGAALRVNAMWQDNGGVGRDNVKDKSRAFAPSLALGLGTPNRAFLSYQHVKQDDTPDYGLPVPAFPGYASTPPSPAIPWTDFYGFTADYDRVTSNAYAARLEHDFTPDLKVTNQTRFSENERDAIVTGPGTNATSYVPATGLLTRSRQANNRETDILSNQTNLTTQLSSGKFTQDVSGGLEFTRENAYSPTFVSITLTPIPVAGPDPTATPSGTPARSGASTRVRTDTAAVYGFDTVKLSERWQLNGGLRWEHYRTTSLAIAVGGVPTSVEATDDILSWKTGLVFKPAPNGSLYAACGISLTPPGTDFTLSTAAGNQNNPTTAPQQVTSYETGTKWDFFKGRLATTAALFKTTNNNTVYTDPVLGPIPAGRQTVQGLELNVSGKVTDHWLLFAGFAYLDSRIDSGTTSGNNPTGAELPLTPRFSGNLWTTYRLPHGLTFGGGTQYVDATSRRDATTTVPRTMPAYWLFNSVLSYEATKHLSLRFNVNNVFNQRYVQSFNNNGARFNPGAPRAYLLSLNFKY
jgi:catecholate siderophore receptor